MLEKRRKHESYALVGEDDEPSSEGESEDSAIGQQATRFFKDLERIKN